jgi:glycosyltransferase involved in cell wall biosynthesis
MKTKPLQVLHILRPGIGGAARHLELLLQNRDTPDIEFSLIASPLEDPVFPEKLRPYVKRLWVIPLERQFAPWKDFCAFCRIFWILLHYPFDIVHTHASKAGLLGRVAAFLLGIRQRFYTPHGFYFHYQISPRQKRFYFAMERILAILTTRVFCVTQEEAQQAQALYPSRKISMIPNALDALAFQQASSRPLLDFPVPLDAFGIVMIARFTPPKDPFTLLRAFAQVAPQFRQAVLVFAGEGELLAESQALAHALEISERTFFLGQRSDVPALLRWSRFSVLSSYWEGLPYTLLESLAGECTVIASDIPGHLQVIQDGLQGRIFRTGDPSHLARVLEELLHSPLEAQHLAEKGREWVLKNFEIQSWWSRFSQEYLRNSAPQKK